MSTSRHRRTRTNPKGQSYCPYSAEKLMELLRAGGCKFRFTEQGSLIVAGLTKIDKKLFDLFIDHPFPLDLVRAARAMEKVRPA